jgi:hypothetical protein
MQTSPNPVTRAESVDSGLPPGSVPHLIEALLATLAQLDELLETLSDDQYVRAALPGLSSGIGPHVRHCLDHVSALAQGLRGGSIDYEQRERGTLVETDRTVARATLQNLCAELKAQGHFSPSRPTDVAVRLSADAQPLRVGSTLGRELAFVQSHTIHHSAMIAALALAQGVRPAERFGYAPATLSYLAQRECVPSR